MKLERYEDGAVYLRTNEADDVVASLELCQDCLLQLKEQPARWKWLIIALHNAVQGAMACHLSGTAQLGALEKKSASRWLEYLTASRCGRPAPIERLADFMELFSRLYSANKRLEQAGPIIQVTDAQKRSLKKLNDLGENLPTLHQRAGRLSLVACEESSGTRLQLSKALPTQIGHSDT